MNKDNAIVVVKETGRMYKFIDKSRSSFTNIQWCPCCWMDGTMCSTPSVTRLCAGGTKGFFLSSLTLKQREYTMK